MANSDQAPKPEVGTVAPVQVVVLWRHPLVLITAAITSLPLILATLVQLQALPGLPTNVTAGLASAVSAVTLLVTICRALGLLGAPVVSPTAAARLIQTDAPPE